MLTTVLYIIFLITAVIGIVFGLKRGFNKALSRFIGLVLTLFLSILSARLISPVIVKAIFSIADGGELSALCDYINAGGNGSEKLAELISHAASPIAFFGTFLVINLIIWIVYLCLAKKISYVKNDKVLGLRIGGTALNIVTSLLFVSAMLTPFIYAKEVIYAVNENTSGNVSETSETALDAFNDPIIKAVDIAGEKIYVPLLTQMRAGGRVTTVTSLLGQILEAAHDIETAADKLTGSDNTDDIYAFADVLAENVYIDELIGAVISDFPDHGDVLEELLDTDMTFANKGSVLDRKIKELMRDTRKASVFIKSLGTVASMKTALEQPADKESIAVMFENISSDSAEAVNELFSVEVINDVLKENDISSKELSVDAYTSTMKEITSQIAEINDNSSLSDNERSEIIKKESAAFSELLQYIDGTDKATASPERVIQAVKTSTVLSNTIKVITEGGSKANPFGIKEKADRSTLNDILTKNGIEENSELYGSILALIPNE